MVEFYLILGKHWICSRGKKHNMVQENKSVNMKIIKNKKIKATSGGEAYSTLIHRLLNMIWKLEDANESSWHLLFPIIFFL